MQREVASLRYPTVDSSAVGSKVRESGEVIRRVDDVNDVAVQRRFRAVVGPNLVGKRGRRGAAVLLCVSERMHATCSVSDSHAVNENLAGQTWQCDYA